MVDQQMQMLLSKRKLLAVFLSGPFYWFGFVAVVVLLIFLWSGEQVEGVSAADRY